MTLSSKVTSIFTPLLHVHNPHAMPPFLWPLLYSRLDVGVWYKILRSAPIVHCDYVPLCDTCVMSWSSPYPAIPRLVWLASFPSAPFHSPPPIPHVPFPYPILLFTITVEIWAHKGKFSMSTMW
jgi:hypothetical protein